MSLVHVQNSLAADFASCADEKQVTVVNSALGGEEGGGGGGGYLRWGMKLMVLE